jgi:hypothetical protein
MNPEAVNELAEIAERLAPAAPGYRHQRLFSERDFDFLGGCRFTCRLCYHK